MVHPLPPQMNASVQVIWATSVKIVVVFHPGWENVKVDMVSAFTVISVQRVRVQLIPIGSKEKKQSYQT